MGLENYDFKSSSFDANDFTEFSYSNKTKAFDMVLFLQSEISASAKETTCF